MTQRIAKIRDLDCPVRTVRTQPSTFSLLVEAFGIGLAVLFAALAIVLPFMVFGIWWLLLPFVVFWGISLGACALKALSGRHNGSILYLLMLGTPLIGYTMYLLSTY